MSPRSFSEDFRIVRYWHPLGCPAIELEKSPQGGVITTVVYAQGGVITTVVYAQGGVITTVVYAQGGVITTVVYGGRCCCRGDVSRPGLQQSQEARITT